MVDWASQLLLVQDVVSTSADRQKIMRDVDLFIIDYFPSSKQLGAEWLERGKIQKVAAEWVQHIIADCQSRGIRLNKRPIRNQPFEDGLEFTVRARLDAFTGDGTDVFILADNDMLPFTADDVEEGINLIESRDDFAILSAMPEPHAINPAQLMENSERVLEHYACGGFRFCRKVRHLSMPPDRVPGYDGIFCRKLKHTYGKKCGYLKQSRAFHLGTHCTSLWNQANE